MKVLFVGAGAVGQVYAFHARRGGAEIAFFVKEKHAAALKRGFTLYPLNRDEPREKPVRFGAYSVLTRHEEVAAEKWDAVVLCMSSTGLRGGSEWLPEFVKHIGEATVVSLLPQYEDRAYILKSVPEDRLVSGMISLISYHAPLPGERVPEEGMAYWFPPMTPFPFSGPAERTKKIAALFNEGGMPSKVVDDVARQTAFPGVVLQCLVAALELEGWSFDRLRKSPRLKQTMDAIREGWKVASARVGTPPPFPLSAGLSTVIKFVLGSGRDFVPLDLETYVRVHFTKVGDQMRLGLAETLADGKKRGIEMPNYEALQRDLLALDRSPRRAAQG